MKKVMRFVVWICKHFNRDEILEIVDELIKVINDKNPDIKPKDDFKKNHPNYRDFSTDPLAPLDAVDVIKPVPELNYQDILAEYLHKNGKPLTPVNVRNDKNRVPQLTRCPHCAAPHEYIYYNDGKNGSSLNAKSVQIHFNCIKNLRIKPNSFVHIALKGCLNGNKKMKSPLNLDPISK